METSFLIFSEVHEDLMHDYVPGADDFFELRLYLYHFLQIACTPNIMKLKYEGPLLKCLATIHIVPHGCLFFQSPIQQISWQWLKTTLYHATSALSCNTCILLLMEFSMLPLPFHYDYLCMHSFLPRKIGFVLPVPSIKLFPTQPLHN